MKAGLLITLLVAVAVGPGVAVATDRPESFDFEYTFVPDSAPEVILDNFVQWFPLTTTDPSAPVSPIVYLELEIAGLSHQAPMDLNFILLDPFGTGLQLMDEAGDQHEIENITLLFSDKGIPLTDDALQGFPDTIYSPDGPGTFSQFNVAGPGVWYLVVIDDAPEHVGSFESVTLRGTVPEPATLSLLALGALAIVRCRRRRR